MRGWIGIRQETKDRTQRRAPLSPAQVRWLARREGIRTIVQPWANRVFPIEEYQMAGALISEDLSRANIVFGVKEIGEQFIEPTMAYCFFSHVAKGQPYNMPMLRVLMERRASLLDYELVRGADGKRTVFFGEYAGYAGMIDTLWALGRRLAWEGYRSPFSRVRYATEYGSLAEAEAAVRAAGRVIRRDGIPSDLTPCVFAFTGYGRVAAGAQRIADLLPTEDIAPSDLPTLFRSGKASRRKVYSVKLRKPDMYRPVLPGQAFDTKEFSLHPDRYRSRLDQLLPYLTVLVNGIYWEPHFPRLVTRSMIRSLFSRPGTSRLRVIGDITCDVEGSIELTVKTTDATNPVFVVNPRTGVVRDGWEGRGPVVLAVDKLPTELPREASEAFGRSLLPYVARLANADYTRPTGLLRIPKAFRDAIVVHRGRLTPRFRSLHDAVRKHGGSA